MGLTKRTDSELEYLNFWGFSAAGRAFLGGIAASLLIETTSALRDGNGSKS